MKRVLFFIGGSTLLVVSLLLEAASGSTALEFLAGVFLGLALAAYVWFLWPAAGRKG